SVSSASPVSRPPAATTCGLARRSLGRAADSGDFQMGGGNRFGYPAWTDVRSLSPLFFAIDTTPYGWEPATAASIGSAASQSSTSAALTVYRITTPGGSSRTAR